jgi:hypothetical protein
LMRENPPFVMSQVQLISLSACQADAIRLPEPGWG